MPMSDYLDDYERGNFRERCLQAIDNAIEGADDLAIKLVPVYAALDWRFRGPTEPGPGKLPDAKRISRMIVDRLLHLAQQVPKAERPSECGSLSGGIAVSLNYNCGVIVRFQYDEDYPIPTT